MVGYWLAGPLIGLLPSRERMDQIAYSRGTHVSVTRRITAALVDWMVLGGAAVLVVLFVKPLRTLLLGDTRALVWLTVFGFLYAAMVLLYFILGEWLQKGLTIGKRLTHIRLVDARDSGRPRLWQCAVRYSLLYFGFMPLPFAALLFLLYAMDGEGVQWFLLLLCLFSMLLYAACVVWAILSVVNRRNQLPHGALSKTRNISTVRLPAGPEGNGRTAQA
jgi:uncharacterized RDD family membrane protein YckC